jgi:hypothetical protein
MGGFSGTERASRRGRMERRMASDAFTSTTRCHEISHSLPLFPSHLVRESVAVSTVYTQICHTHRTCDPAPMAHCILPSSPGLFLRPQCSRRPSRLQFESVMKHALLCRICQKPTSNLSRAISVSSYIFDMSFNIYSVWPQTALQLNQ